MCIMKSFINCDVERMKVGEMQVMRIGWVRQVAYVREK